MGVKPYFFQVSIERRGDHSAGVGKFHTVPYAIGSAAPTGIDQPDICLTSAQFFTQQVCIFCRVQGQEWRTETGGKYRFRFFNPYFRACHTGRVAANKVVHSLFGGQPGNRRQHAIGITGQEKDVFRITFGTTGPDGVWNMINRIRHPRIFRNTTVGKIHLAGPFHKFYIFQDSAMANSAENIRFFFFAQIDGFSVTTAFKIKNFVVGPGMFVIADKRAVGIGAEGRFAGAGKSKKERDIAGCTHIGGAMHGERVGGARRQHEIDD